MEKALDSKAPNSRAVSTSDTLDTLDTLDTSDTSSRVSREINSRAVSRNEINALRRI